MSKITFQYTVLTVFGISSTIPSDQKVSPDLDNSNEAVAHINKHRETCVVSHSCKLASCHSLSHIYTAGKIIFTWPAL
jgi:hypothetical protein